MGDIDSEEKLHRDSPREDYEYESYTDEDDYDDDEVSIYSLTEDTPSSVRLIACLKRKEDMKRFEETDECFILDFDPFESLEVTKLSLDDNNDDADLSVVAEKGPVACRDYPHSRHLCLKFPFSRTPHQSCCELCFCYVCDLSAPCKYWTQPLAPHCNADSSKRSRGICSYRRGSLMRVLRLIAVFTLDRKNLYMGYYEALQS